MVSGGRESDPLKPLHYANPLCKTPNPIERRVDQSDLYPRTLVIGRITIPGFVVDKFMATYLFFAPRRGAS